jgi:hypothetical protein
MESAERSCFDLSRGGKSARPLLSQAPGRALPRRVAFLFGFACGYAVRAAVSRRRRAAPGQRVRH